MSYNIYNLWLEMGKKNNKSNMRSQRKQKATTAITFDEEERSNFLKGMFGAKQRRREFYKKKME